MVGTPCYQEEKSHYSESQVQTKYCARTHKYGIRISKSVKEAKETGAHNGNILWWDAICDEMKNVPIAMISDVKLGENYRRKARFVAGGHKTEAPRSIAPSSVVSRDSVRIALLLLIAALNELDALACNVQHAYFTAPCRERVYTIAGDEFGSDSGKLMIIKRALYGLKSAIALAPIFWVLCVH